MSYRIERWKQVYAPNPAMLRYILVSEGYRVFQWGDSPASVVPMQRHSTDYTHWIVSGALEMTVEGSGTFVLERGDRGFLPANTYYSARVISEETVVYLVGEKVQ